MIDEIQIKTDGKPISRICCGEGPEDILSCLEGYDSIYLICDANVGEFAFTIARAIAWSERHGGEDRSEEHHCCHGTEADEHHCHNNNPGGDGHCCHGGEAGEHPCHHGEGHQADEGHHCCHGGGGCHRRSLTGGRLKSIIGLHTSEAGKTMETVTAICGRLLEDGVDRGALLLAVGGGITTDMAGFAASIYKRGIRFAYVPTTLLAQVDAAIGGKTGVNYQGYKNMIGVIRQPEFTFICPWPLVTLPRRDFLSGAAEMLKTFIFENRDGNYEKAVTLISCIASREYEDIVPLVQEDIPLLTTLINRAAAVKAGIVGRDQFESGERRKLNLGHTFAHAIEKLSEGSFAHGEAVAAGIAKAAEIAGENALAERLKADLKACGLPVECPYSMSEMADAISKDKKADNGTIRFIVPRSIGHVEELPIKTEELI